MQIPILKKELDSRGHNHIILHTGQHFDMEMSKIFFQELGLNSPDINLGISKLPHGAMTGRMIIEIEKKIGEIKPDLLIVDGDTNSTMAASLAAVKIQLPIIHIEAGIRCCKNVNDRPEEINRVVTDHISSLNCAPVPSALENLANEGLKKRSFLSGDLLLDCFLKFKSFKKDNVITELNLTKKNYYLATLHRPENTDLINFERFKDIAGFLSSLDKKVILPLHPRSKAILEKWKDSGNSLNNFLIIPPVSYFEILGLLDGAEGVFTDSGGLCRDAVWSGCRSLFFFQKGEMWNDIIIKGWAQSGSGNRESIEKAWSKSSKPNAKEIWRFFGEGKAHIKIADAVEDLMIK